MKRWLLIALGAAIIGLSPWVGAFLWDILPNDTWPGPSSISAVLAGVTAFIAGVVIIFHAIYGDSEDGTTNHGPN